MIGIDELGMTEGFEHSLAILAQDWIKCCLSGCHERETVFNKVVVNREIAGHPRAPIYVNKLNLN